MDSSLRLRNIPTKQLISTLRNSKNPAEIGKLLDANRDRVAILAIHAAYLGQERLGIGKNLTDFSDAKAAAFESVLADFFRPITSLDNAILILHPEEQLGAALSRHSVEMAGEPVIIFSNLGNYREYAQPYEIMDVKRVLQREIEFVFAAGLYLGECFTRGVNSTRSILGEVGKGHLPIIYNPILVKTKQEMKKGVAEPALQMQ